MVKIAHITNGVVTNISVANELQDGDILANGCRIGDLWDGLQFISGSPEQTVPFSVSMAQARQQLIALNVYDTVNTAIASIPQQAQVDWEYRTSVDRDYPLVAQVQQLLGWTDAQTDEYFIAASKL